MNGNTVVENGAPPARPQDATLPPRSIDVSRFASVSPPTLSIAADHFSLSSGRFGGPVKRSRHAADDDRTEDRNFNAVVRHTGERSAARRDAGH